jgi:hypothetical protein
VRSNNQRCLWRKKVDSGKDATEKKREEHEQEAESVEGGCRFPNSRIGVVKIKCWVFAESFL